MNGVSKGLDGRGRKNKFGQGEETVANEGGGERVGGGRWESGEKMGCDEWRETGREPEKIGFQGAGRERAGRCKPDRPPPPATHQAKINTCHTRN